MENKTFKEIIGQIKSHEEIINNLQDGLIIMNNNFKEFDKIFKGLINKINEQGFGYLINFKTPEGMDAYIKILHGQLDKVVTNDQTIQEVKKVESIKKSLIFNYGYGIPFIPFLDYDIAKINSDTHEKTFNKNDELTNTNYIVSTNEKNLHLIFYQKLIDYSFLISEKENKTQMQMYFKHITNQTMGSKLIRIKNKLKRLTGLDKFIDFKIGISNDQEQDLNFVEIQLALNFSNKIINAFHQDKQKMINYLINQKLTDISEQDKLDNFILLLKNHDVSNNEISKFGENFWKSTEFFNIQYQLVSKCGGEMTYEISGKRISHLFRKKTFELSDDCPLN